MDSHRTRNQDDESTEHLLYGDAKAASVTRPGSPVSTEPLRLLGVNVPNLLTTLGLAGALIWHASVVTWRAAELSSAVKDLQASVQVLRQEMKEFQAESRTRSLNVEARLSRLEAAFESHVRGR